MSALMLPDAFVLAGGRSRRMGFDKARAPIGDPPLSMAVAVALQLRGLGGRVTLVRRVDDGLPFLWPDGTAVDVLFESEAPDHHPLYGVLAAFQAATTPLVIIASCDVPHLTTDDWVTLIDAAPAVAFDGTHRHPTVAVVPVDRAAAARALIDANGPAHALTADLPCVALPADHLRDIDTPAELPPGPVARLLSRLPATDPEVRARLAAGERRRLMARGILDEQEVA